MSSNWALSGKRKCDSNDDSMGKHHPNLTLDNGACKAEFPESEMLEHSANLIAKNLCSQVDDKGRQHMFLTEPMDHKNNATAVMGKGGYKHSGITDI